MTKAFNLIDEPWIPVRRHDGTVRDVSLLDALTRAGDCAALAETSPPNLIALYRVLLAVVHRALIHTPGRWTDDDRARWFREGLPEQALREYLENWRERFWLFHPGMPFMQVAALAGADETRDKLKPWTQVALESASGNAPVVFNHSIDGLPTAVPYGQACRNLLGFLQFTPGGLVKTFRGSDNAGALSNTAAVLPTGASLGETLSLALHPWTRSAADDLPAWESAPPMLADLCADPKLASGPNDRYTRLSRAVLWVPDAMAGHVRHLRFGAGLALGEDAGAPDPMASYRVNKEGKSIRISFHDGRAIWRDLPSLVPDTSGKFDVPPAVLGWAANLHAAIGKSDTPVTVLVAGLASNQAKLLRWRIECIDMRQTLLTDPDAAATLRLKVREADSVYYRLRGIAADMIAATMPDPKHKDTKARARSIQEAGPGASAYFSAAERGLPDLMQRISAGDIDTAFHGWSAVLTDAAERAWEATRRSLGNSATVLRAEARTHPKFRSLVRSLAAGDLSTIA